MASCNKTCDIVWHRMDWTCVNLWCSLQLHHTCMNSCLLCFLLIRECLHFHHYLWCFLLYSNLETDRKLSYQCFIHVSTNRSEELSYTIYTRNLRVWRSSRQHWFLDNEWNLYEIWDSQFNNCSFFDQIYNVQIYYKFLKSITKITKKI